MSSAGSDFELVFAALEQWRVRYLVVGGVAVVLHGYPRFTEERANRPKDREDIEKLRAILAQGSNRG